MNWELLERHADLHRFVVRLIDYRRSLPDRVDPSLSLAEVIQRARVRWHGAKLDRPDWGDDSRSVAFTVESAQRWYHLIFNAYWESIEFDLPPVPSGFQPWHRIIDTDLPSPHDIGDGHRLAEQKTYLVQPRSTVVVTGQRSGPKPI